MMKTRKNIANHDAMVTESSNNRKQYNTEINSTAKESLINDLQQTIKHVKIGTVKISFHTVSGKENVWGIQGPKNNLLVELHYKHVTFTGKEDSIVECVPIKQEVEDFMTYCEVKESDALEYFPIKQEVEEIMIDCESKDASSVCETPAFVAGMFENMSSTAFSLESHSPIISSEPNDLCEGASMETKNTIIPIGGFTSSLGSMEGKRPPNVENLVLTANSKEIDAERQFCDHHNNTAETQVLTRTFDMDEFDTGISLCDPIISEDVDDASQLKLEYQPCTNSVTTNLVANSCFSSAEEIHQHDVNRIEIKNCSVFLERLGMSKIKSEITVGTDDREVILIDEQVNGKSEQDDASNSTKKSFKKCRKIFGPEQHQITKPNHNCLECKKSFRTLGRFANHQCIRSGKNIFECSHCDMKFSEIVNFQRHQHNVHGIGEIPYQCSHCDKKFFSEDTLKLHQRVHDGEAFNKCTLCDRKFTDFGHLIRHKHSAHGIGEVPHQCSHCDKKFFSEDTLKLHQRVHDGEAFNKCTLCDRKFTNFGHLIRHKHSAHGIGEVPHQCSYCHMKFFSKDLLFEHSQIHAREKIFLCAQCNMEFTDLVYLQRHEHVFHKSNKCSINPTNSIKHDENPAAKQQNQAHTLYRCSICGARFCHLRTLGQHERTHFKESTFECAKCHMMFPEALRLKRQKRFVYGIGLPYLCLQCNKKFYSKANIEQHNKLHTEEPAYWCSECMATYCHLSSLKHDLH